MKSISILIADDDPALRSYLARFLISKGYVTTAASSGDEAIAEMKGQPTPDLVLLDVMMPGTDGLDVLANMKKLNPEVPVIILSGVGHIRTVVEAIRLGAADYLSKPFEEEALELTIQNALEKLKLRDEVNELRRRLAEPNDSDLGASSNPKMVRIREVARQVAETDVPVLITGESGVGKEVLSRYIHAHSGRADQPYVKVNCAALPHDLLESELFGYERGAFTGALTDKPGKFELAGKGTLVLDEIGEMSPVLQAKLLHVLQDNEYSRLGGKRVVKVHARILASTNRKLEQSVARGEFREDLYFRLNVIAIEIPPLRERREDIPLLCTRFIDKYREKYKSPVRQLPQDLMESFTRFDWPGNIRQLENTIKRYLILPGSDLMLSSATGTPEHNDALEQATPVCKPESLDLKETGAVAAEQAEKELVLRTLDETHWNRKTTARILNISYKALRNRLKKWQLKDSRTTALYDGLTPPRELTL
jgi:two-component system response regulator AtoC